MYTFPTFDFTKEEMKQIQIKSFWKSDNAKCKPES